MDGWTGICQKALNRRRPRNGVFVGINFTMNEMNAISFRSVNPSNVMSIAAFEYEFIHSKGGDVLVNRYIWI